MPTDFIPRLDILPTAQRRLWPELSMVPEEFALYGGTGIALHLGHRESVGFDFFGTRAFDPDVLLGEIPFLAGATVTQRGKNTLGVTVDQGAPVRVSFFGLPGLPRLTAPHVAAENGLKVASLLDLAGTKASVVQKRSEARDYIDIAAMLTDGRVDLPTALAAAQAIYGAQFNPQITLKALTYFDDGNLSRLPAGTKELLVEAVRAVDLGRLPDIGGWIARQQGRGRPER